MERRGRAVRDQQHIQVIITTMHNRRQLSITDGEGGRANVRTLEPHILFKTKDGNVLLGGYQVNDSTRAGKPPVWHNIPVSKISKVTEGTERFLVRGGFNPGDRTKYYEVISAVVVSTDTVH